MTVSELVLLTTAIRTGNAFLYVLRRDRVRNIGKAFADQLRIRFLYVLRRDRVRNLVLSSRAEAEQLFLYALRRDRARNPRSSLCRPARGWRFYTPKGV